MIDNVMEGGYEIVWDEDGSANEILARDVRPSKTAKPRAAVPKPRGPPSPAVAAPQPKKIQSDPLSGRYPCPAGCGRTRSS